MLLTVLFSWIHDNTKETHSGYFWSFVCFLVLSIVSMVLKIQIGMWDRKRGNILNSKTPNTLFMAYLESEKNQTQTEPEEDEIDDDAYFCQHSIHA